MRLILLGPPGCGKGTQAELLCERNNLVHIGTGDLLRTAMYQNTPVGARARPFVEAGHLVPDDLVNDLVAERFLQGDAPPRFVLDGYPRTLAQTQALEKVLQIKSLPLTAAVLLVVDDQEIVHRVGGRWSCPKPGCKATYHTISKPPKVAGICNHCGTKLVQREDDRPETVRERLKVYHKDTEEMIPYYRSKGLLREVLGHGSIEQIYTNLMTELKKADTGP